MRGRHGMHVVLQDLAVRSGAVVIGGAIPTSHAGFSEKGLAVGWDGNDFVFRAFVGGFFVPRLGSRCCRGRGSVVGLRFRCRRRRHFDTSLFVTGAAGQQYQGSERDEEESRRAHG